MFNITLPPQINPLFTNDQKWNFYSETKKRITDSLNEIELDYYKNLVELPNVANTNKRAVLQKIGEQNLTIFKNPKLCSLIFLLLSYFDFKVMLRKQFFTIVDKFLNVQNFLFLLDEDKDLAGIFTI